MWKAWPYAWCFVSLLLPSFRHIGIMFSVFAFLTRLGVIGTPWQFALNKTPPARPNLGFTICHLAFFPWVLQLHLTTIFLPISLNSLDREGVRLLSLLDPQITSKTRCRCRWYHSRRYDWAQVGVRWGLRTILRFLSRRSVVEPSWGDQGHYAFGVVFILVP